MPLPFPSLSHGTIAFGFFNIELDMLLLEHLFFFADRFCGAVQSLCEAAGAANEPDSICEVEMAGFAIDNRQAVGNVNAAIGGWDLSGFIGATYREFPFPPDPAGFKQKPYGARNQPWADKAIGEYGRTKCIALRLDGRQQQVAIDEFVFSSQSFARLIDYVDRGGYPRWQNEARPDYVVKMMDLLEQSSTGHHCVGAGRFGFRLHSPLSPFKQ